MKNVYLSIASIGCLTATSLADGNIFSEMQFTIRAGENTSFNIFSQSSSGSAIAAIQPGDCSPECSGVDLDVQVDSITGPGTTLVEFGVVVADGGTCQASVGILSQAFSSSSLISVVGRVTGSGSGDHCTLLCILGGSASSEVNYEIIVDNGGTGSVDIDFPNDCLFAFSSNANTPRTVTANIICIDGPNGTTIIPSSSTQIGLAVVQACAGTVPASPGVYGMSSIFISITDSIHDVTGDGRFNVEDLNFLQGILGTPDAFNAQYTNLFDYNQDGEVDQIDVDRIGKFIDAGLSSGLFGDTNQDGVVDCCDLDGYDSIFGSTFNSANTVYIAELDWDLDGDIDAVDQVEFNNTACASDLNDDHVINFFDISLFLSLFDAGSLTVDFNGDGVLNFFDISIFLSAQNKSCS
ncbi:MAG: hypothetical protein JKX70_02410 [Phycisphaerales bacterium]|nr:hypothetical protein [Phycisphaerales bacterium]